MSLNDNDLQIEVIQPEINGQIQKTTVGELKNWVKEGKLRPNHKVRIKNLSWIEVQKIPSFQSLFETKNKEAEEAQQAIHLTSQPLIKSAATEIVKPKIEESATSFLTKPLFGGKNKAETDDDSGKTGPVSNEPSIAFKKFEEKKALAKSKRSKAAVKKAQILPNKPKKSSLVKSAVGFLAGFILTFLLSLGGSYLWIYELKAPHEIDEKSISELSGLDDKLTSAKVELRLKAAKEQESKDAAAPDHSIPQTDISQEIAKLENQYSSQRKSIIENHRTRLQETEFNTTFYFSLAVLLVLFLLVRILFGKTNQPSEEFASSVSPELHTSDSLEFETTIVQKVKADESRDGVTKPENVDDQKSAETSAPKSANKTDTKIIYVQAAENPIAGETVKPRNCLLHQDTPSKFVCETCSNYFCDECPVSFEQEENGCPFCKIACKSIEIITLETIDAPESESRKKNKPNLLDLGDNTAFVGKKFADEKPYKLGVIPAFVIAALFSTAIAILWVYKLTPYLENRNKEISQNVSANETQKPENAAGKPAENANSATETAETNVSANEPCIDPETRQPFECDETTRKTLYEHTRKIKSVEKSQQEISKKTSSILSLVLPSADDANQANSPPNVVEETRKRAEKQLFIKVFGCSFVIIFGLLLSTRLFN